MGSSPPPDFRFRQRLALYFLEAHLCNIQPAQIGLQVHDRFIQQENLGHLGA
jgi:hypothetical protein